MIRPGDRVVLKEAPPWIDAVGPETRELIRFCLGRPLVVDEIDRNGLLVLLAGPEADRRFGGFMNDLRIEEAFVEKVT